MKIGGNVLISVTVKCFNFIVINIIISLIAAPAAKIRLTLNYNGIVKLRMTKILGY